MRREEYPAQEPLPPFALAYDRQVWEAASEVRYEEVAYGSDPYQRMAIVRPERPNGTILAFFHGGGWTCGFKEWNLLNAPALTQLGITFASIGYRLAPGVTYPRNVEDCAAGVAHLWELEAPRQPGTPRLIVAGHSAGGHLASLLALEPRWLAHHGLPVDLVRGCAPLSGVYQFGPESGLSQRPRFLGSASDTTVERDASPLYRITPDAPPFFLSWGTRDFPHLVVQGERMAAALKQAGVPTTVGVYEGFDHFDVHVTSGQPDSEWVHQLSQWLNELPSAAHAS